MMKQIWGLIASAVVGTIFLHCLYSGYRERTVSFRKIELKRSENPVFYWAGLLFFAFVVGMCFYAFIGTIMAMKAAF